MRLGLKVLMVIGLTLAILVPLLMIRGTIQERQQYRQEAVQSIARSYAGAQRIAGPVLLVPYTDTIEVEEKNDKGEVIRTVKRDGDSGVWTFFPETMDLQGKLVPSTRRLGLHEVRVHLHPEVDATIKLNVARSAEEAQLQASGKSIQELAAEEEAAAEFEIAELFDDIGSAGRDEDDAGN